MPLKVKNESTQLLKIPDFNTLDHLRLYEYGRMIGMTKRKAGKKILTEFLRKNVKLEIEQ